MTVTITLKESNWYAKLLNKLGLAWAITLCTTMRIAGALDVVTFKHEFSHIKDYLRDGFFSFYYLYFWQFVAAFFRFWNWDKAYRYIVTEAVAYAHQYEPLTPLEQEIYNSLKQTGTWTGDISV